MGTYRENIADVSGIEASIARILQTMDFWSDIMPTVTVNAAAAYTYGSRGIYLKCF